jgi:hypothetical protein
MTFSVSTDPLTVAVAFGFLPPSFLSESPMANPEADPIEPLLPETWDELIPRLGPEWTPCLAWAVGGGDPQGLDIRLQGGRAQYTSAWCVLKEKAQWVRLARLEPGDAHGPREVVRKVSPETVVEVRRMNPTLPMGI